MSACEKLCPPLAQLVRAQSLWIQASTCKNERPPLAQLVRASSLYLEGPWFESRGADGHLYNGRAQNLYRRYTSGVLGSNPRGRT